MDNKQKEQNTNQQIKVWLFILFLVIIIFYNFFYAIPVGNIDTGLVTLILILLIVVLSESFDNFSLGQLLSMSKTVTEKKQEITKLEKRNDELINQIISITNSQNQNSSQHVTLNTPENKTEIDNNKVETTNSSGFKPELMTNKKDK